MRQKKVYKTGFGFAERQNIDKSFMDMVQNAMQQTPLFRNKQLFFQYAILLYIAGKRRIEPFLMPVTIYEHKDDRIKYYEIKTAVAKHFKGDTVKCADCEKICKSIKDWKLHAQQNHEKKPNHKGYSYYSTREYAETYIIVDNVYEHAMMQYLLQGRQRMILDFTPLLPQKFQELDADSLMNMEYKSSLFSGITKKFKMFKMSITDGTKIIENTNIVPHMLRHMRLYDVKINHKYSNSFIQKMFSWEREEMISYYADVRHMFDKTAMLEEIRQHKAILPLPTQVIQ